MKTFIFLFKIRTRDEKVLLEYSEPIQAASIAEAEAQLNGRTNFQIFTITK